jgi:hypothetical protein
LLPANSNTFDVDEDEEGWDDDRFPAVDAGGRDAGLAEAGADNVIIMPIQPTGGRAEGVEGWPPRGQRAEGGPRPARGGEAPFGDVLAHAIAMPPAGAPLAERVAEEAVEATHSEEPEERAEPTPTPVAASDRRPPPLPMARSGDVRSKDAVVAAGDEMAAVKGAASGAAAAGRMNVRITQRTADFEIPISAMSQGQPIAFLKRGAKITFAEPEVEIVQDGRVFTDDQLRLDFDRRGEAVAVEAENGDDRLEVVAGEGAAVALEAREGQFGAGTVTAPVEGERVIALGELDREGDADAGAAIAEWRRTDLPSEADLVEISKRFAPQRRGEQG